MPDDNQNDQEIQKRPANPNLEAVQANQPVQDSGDSEQASEQEVSLKKTAPQVPQEDSDEKPKEVGEEKTEEKSHEVFKEDLQVEESRIRQIPQEDEPPREPAKSSEPKESTQKKDVVPDVKKQENKPASAPVSKKIGKERKQISKTKFILGCSGIGLFVFLVFIVLMVFMISKAGADSQIMKTLGIGPSQIKAFLLMVINLVFGFLALLFLVLMTIGIFRLVSAKKTDKEKKTKGTKMTVFTLIPLVVTIFLWSILYSFINSIQPPPEKVLAEIVVLSPEDTTDLIAPVEITFSAENVAKALQFGGFEIQAMDWDFNGDGTFETPITDNPEITYLYNRRGNYNVALRVRIVGEEEARFYYQPIVIQDADFKADPSTGFAPLEVQFDASDLVPTGAKIQSFDWDFDGDGRYDLEGTDPAPRYTFDKIGIYTVKLRTVDQQNKVENYSRDIEVKVSDTPLITPVIDATPSLSGAIPLQVRFDASQSSSLKGKITRYDWDFGDGSDSESGKSVSHVFNKPGYYTVKLTVTENSGQTASTTVEVHTLGISSVPVAKITTNPPYDEETGFLTGVLPFKISFDASASTDDDDDIVDYQWDFNSDGDSDKEGKKVVYTFEKAGTYYVDLTVKDTEDQTDTAALKVVVEEPGVKALIKASPVEGTVPLVVNFDGSASTTFEGSIVSYEWNFGDDTPTTVTGASLSHKYTNVGDYTALLNVVTDKGESASTSQVIYVREIPLGACFSPSRKSGTAPLAVTFDSKCSTGAISSYSWDFGDGEVSEGRKPTHTFEYPGTYTITLEVADEKSNVSTFSSDVVVEDEEAEVSE